MIKNGPFLPQIKDTPFASEQMRAARGLLGWSRKKLAQKANTSAETIKNIEHGIYSPKKETITAIVEAFARYGVQFVHQESVVSVPADHGQAESTLTFSHVWISRMTVSVSETKEADRG